MGEEANEYMETIKELFEKRSFSDVFDYTPPKRIIKTLLSLRQEHFSSVGHFMMFKKFVEPKLRVAGKAWTSTPMVRYNKYLYLVTLDIILSKSYCVLKFMKTRYSVELESIAGEYYPKIQGGMYRIDAYVIGFNSDGRLFVNKVGHRSIDYRTHGVKKVEVWEKNGVVVAVVDDSLIHQLLGYQHEHDSERVTISAEGRHRVQGEIVLEAIKVGYSSIADAVGVGEPVGVVQEALIDYLQRYSASELMRMLTSLGLDVEYARRLNDHGVTLHHAVVVPGAINASDSHRTVARKVYTVLKALRRLNEYAVDFVEDEEHIPADFAMYNEYINTVFDIAILNTLTNDRLQSIVFVPRTINHRESKLYYMLFNELREAMKNVKRQSYTITVGNHVINLRNAISLNVEYEPTIKPSMPMLTNWVIRFDLGYYYADSMTTAVIQHREHGSTEIGFDGQYLIRFETNDLSTDHAYEWNRSVIQALMQCGACT